jgi:hypothetical protein
MPRTLQQQYPSQKRRLLFSPHAGICERSFYEPLIRLLHPEHCGAECFSTNLYSSQGDLEQPQNPRRGKLLIQIIQYFECNILKASQQ